MSLLGITNFLFNFLNAVEIFIRDQLKLGLDSPDMLEGVPDLYLGTLDVEACSVVVKENPVAFFLAQFTLGFLHVVNS